MSQTTQGARPRLVDPAWHRRMRDSEPVAWDPKVKAWTVFRYEDVTAVLADHRTYSSDFSDVLPARKGLTDELREGNILAMDPPRHHKLRSLVGRAFSPRTIGRLEGRIAELTEELLDQARDRSSFELVSELAYPLPVTVIAELLGVPTSDRAQFKVWADALLARDVVDPTDEAAIEAATVDIRKFHDYLREHVARRRVEPGHDLLSDLIAAEIDGQRLTDQEIVGFGTVLLLAGHITTTLLLGNALLCLDEHPEAQDALRADPSMIPLAIEETLRYRSPVSWTSRVTTTGVRLGGKEIPARQLVSVSLASANHDEREFHDPDAFIVDRDPNPHVAFGKGIHFCLGAPLARLEGRIALGVLLRRFSRLRVDREQPLEPYTNPGFNGTRTLHLLVEPARAAS
jgi:cytochrome P450